MKAAYVASQPRALILKDHEIGTLLWELGTFLNRGQLAITGTPGCIFSGILHLSPGPPHLDRPRCAEGLAPEESVCEEHTRVLAVPLRGRTLQAGMLPQRSLDAGDCFIKLHLILSYLFDSLLFYLAETFGSVRVSSVKFNSQGRL